MDRAPEAERLGGAGVEPAGEGGDPGHVQVGVRDADDAAGVDRDPVAGDRVVLDHQDPRPVVAGQEEGRRQAVDAGSDHHDVPRAGRHPGVPALEDLAGGHGEPPPARGMPYHTGRARAPGGPASRSARRVPGGGLTSINRL